MPVMKRKPCDPRPDDSKRLRVQRRAGMRIVRNPRYLPSIQIKRTFYNGIWQPAVTTTNDFWKYYQYTLSNMPDQAQYTSIFDQYKITGVLTTFIPRFDNFDGSNRTTVGTTNSSGVALSIINDPYTVVSPSGTYTSANYNTFAEQGRVRLYEAGKTITVYSKPTIANTLLSGSNQLVKAPWLQTSNNLTVHYCFHAFAHDHNFSGSFMTSQAWDVYTTFYISFRGMR